MTSNSHFERTLEYLATGNHYSWSVPAPVPKQQRVPNVALVAHISEFYDFAYASAVEKVYKWCNTYMRDGMKYFVGQKFNGTFDVHRATLHWKYMEKLLEEHG